MKYRDITPDEGAVVEPGDQVRNDFIDWSDMRENEYGASYGNYEFGGFGNWQYRRPVAQDDGVAEALDEIARTQADELRAETKAHQVKPVAETVWDGEGPPPRDADIEVYGPVYGNDEMQWFKAKAYAIIDDKVLAESTTHAGEFQLYHYGQVRPIQPEQTEREKAVKAMCDICWDKVGEFSEASMIALYDAGYRLKGEGDE